MSRDKNSVANQNLSPIREMLFPVHNNELKKFLPMSIIMMMILFNYTIMRDTKDALVANHPVSDAEVISYLKLFVVMPASIGFVVLFTKLANTLSSERIFYVVVSTFLAFFATFAYVIYPNMEFFHPSVDYVHELQANAGERFKLLIAVWGMWGYSAFYMMSELWGSVMISLLFWKFANDIVKTEEAKRFYPLFALLANVALMISGPTVSYLSGFGDQKFMIQSLTVAILVAGAIAMYVYRWMHVNVLTDPMYFDAREEKKTKKSKPKLGVVESFKYIMSSPYIGLIAILVLAYGLSINIIEVVWKKQLKLYSAEVVSLSNADLVVGTKAFKAAVSAKYNYFMGMYSFTTGVVTITLIMFVKGMIRKFGWLTSALMTPIMLGATGLLFLAFTVFKGPLNPVVLKMVGLNSLAMAALIGGLQGVLSKATKYSLFDPTKEMAYIPLDAELKAKGKAAVDVIGGRMGKALGSVTMIALYSITGVADAVALAPVIMVIAGVIVAVWLFSVVALNRLYQKALAENEAQQQKTDTGIETVSKSPKSSKDAA